MTAVRNFEPPDGASTAYGDIVALTEGPDGSLWYVDAGPFEHNNAGSVRRIRNVNANQPPTARGTGARAGGPAPLTVRLSSAGSADPEGQPLTYRWEFGDGGGLDRRQPLAHVRRERPYTARLTASDGSAIHDLGAGDDHRRLAAHRRPSSRRPTARTFRAGDVDRASPAGRRSRRRRARGSSLSWKVVFHHDSHIHPVLDGATGDSGR